MSEGEDYTIDVDTEMNPVVLSRSKSRDRWRATLPKMKETGMCQAAKHIPLQEQSPSDPSNKSTILSDINHKLYQLYPDRFDKARAPDIEYIFQEVNVPVGGCGACTGRLGRWGHALVKYTLPKYLAPPGQSRDERQVHRTLLTQC